MERTMETNPQLELAFDFLENTEMNVFLTGKAGTGKTTFLHRLKQQSPKRMIVLAPTGVAAINAGGMTIHSFFQLPFGPYLAGSAVVGGNNSDGRSFVNRFSREKIRIIKGIDLLVIDEVSMVRADVLDAVDDVLRRFRDKSLPFGGVQLLLIGDIQQLAPVVKEEEWKLLQHHYESPFFFHSNALTETDYVTIELHQVYRQEDSIFLQLLNKVRLQDADAQVLQRLNARYQPGFQPREEEGYITLTTHNWQAKRINESHLQRLSDPPFVFKAEVRDIFPEYAYPTEAELVLKKGAQVMFLKNDSSAEKRYYNGKIGTIVSIAQDNIVVRTREDEEQIRVEREEWSNARYTIDEETKEITETIEGTFTQYPLKLAWAITIHKSQGLTFDKAIIDPHAAFAHGQVYVALSRCRTFEGLVLRSPVNARSLIKDATVTRFCDDYAENPPSLESCRMAHRNYYRKLLLEQFDYEPIRRRFYYLYHLVNEHLSRLYPALIEYYRSANRRFIEELLDVGNRFRLQIERLWEQAPEPLNDASLTERVVKGKAYFESLTREIMVNLVEEGIPEVDNKEIRKTMAKAMENLQEEVQVKMETLEALTSGFSIPAYLKAKSRARLNEIPKKRKAKKSPAAADKVIKTEIPSDILHPELYETLRGWRQAEAQTQGLPAYTILHQRALLGVTNTLPTSSQELLAIPGIGKKVVERYGKQLLELVDAYRFRQQK